jgi:hypothetical protein
MGSTIMNHLHFVSHRQSARAIRPRYKVSWDNFWNALPAYYATTLGKYEEDVRETLIKNTHDAWKTLLRTLEVDGMLTLDKKLLKRDEGISMNKNK